MGIERAVRNTAVETAIQRAISRVDHFLSNGRVKLPRPQYRELVDRMLETQAPSVKVALLFLLFYRLENPDWNMKEVPIGIRGRYGDKLLSEQLSMRYITLHGNITAFGENLGWKGEVRTIDLSASSKFGLLSGLAGVDAGQIGVIADYLASRFAESQSIPKAIPSIGDDLLTFARAKILLHQLIATSSEGHIQQFLIAALLRVHRARFGAEVATHHPHAPDKFDGTAGDIEERVNGEIIRAYEVTVRGDWKNRMSAFKAKMDRFHLTKYVIIASEINNDPEWGEPARLLVNLEPYGRDIAVVDILDFVNVFAAELSARELREPVNLVDGYILNQRLCGRADVRDSFRKVVGKWLDQQSQEPSPQA